MMSWLAIVLFGLVLGWVVARFSGAYIACIAAGHPPDITTFYKAALSPGHPSGLPSVLITLTQAVCCAWFYKQGGWTLSFFSASVATAVLLALAHIDARTRLLPNTLTYPFLVLGLLLAFAGVGVGLGSALLGAVGGYVFLWLVSSTYRMFTKQAGMGAGDLKLFAGLGAWLGWADLWFLLISACLLGVGFAMWQQGSVLPRGYHSFGPFLAIAGISGLLMAA